MVAVLAQWVATMLAPQRLAKQMPAELMQAKETLAPPTPGQVMRV